MSAVLLRRRKLGRTSCREISNFINQLGGSAKVARSWKPLEFHPLSLEATKPEWLVRWGFTGVVGVRDERTLNTSQSIHWCSDKRTGRLDMQAADVPVPKTWSDYNDLLDEETFLGKVVVRPVRHAQGRNLFVFSVESLAGSDALVAKCESMGEGGYYISQLIDKVAEFRVFVVQNRVAWVAQKTPGNPQDVAWNVAQGGRFDNVRWSDWNTKVLDAALKAAKVSGTDFCGVDVMVDAEGNPYVLEVNSAPSQTSPYRQQCVAKTFHYIFSTGSKSPFEDVNWNPRRTWKSYIHPAVRGDE